MRKRTGYAKKTGQLKPNVVVLDIAMPGMNGIQVCRRITARHPRIKVIALSMHSDQRYVTKMLSAGATGYLTKDGAFDEFIKAIRVVAGGETYLEPVPWDDNFRHPMGDQNPSRQHFPTG